MSHQPGNPNMKMLIPMINELQRIFAMVNTKLTLALPQIAVVGSQSAGKSSVLENIVGRDFLPRGGNMVTKRPLILQLVTSQGPEYAVFGHRPQQKFTNYNDVRIEIEHDTKAVVKDNIGVSNLPINLTIYSPHVINLTLVDLPGIVKVAAQGQPLDISKKIDDIILDYISNENCLILAVTPANIDLVTSDALVMARSKDPTGKRTIGVLTKLDMMGRGQDARDVLLNKVVVLERGFIGVVLRGQRVDEYGRTMRELDISAALEFERQFFLSHPAYRDIADRMGVPYLQTTLSVQLSEHILKCLPDLKRELQKRYHDLSTEVCEFRTSSMMDGGTSDAKVLVVLVHELQEDFDAALKGSNMKESDLKTLTGGARIATIFKYNFPIELAKLDLQEKDMRNQLITAIKNIRGFRTGIFTPDEAFEYVVKMQITKFEEPVSKCVDMVVTELKKVIHEVTDKLKRYPLLQQTVDQILIQFLMEREVVTKQACSLYVNTQLAYINTTNEEFIGFSNAEKRNNVSDASHNITNQIIRKGFLRMHTNAKIFQTKEYFFVLSTDNLSWYSDSDQREKKYMIHLESLRLREGEGSFMGKRVPLILYNTDSNNVYKEHRVLELSAENKEEAEGWKEAFSRAGVYSERGSGINNSSTSTDSATSDSHMERQVETINILVSSYMRIVAKMTRDFIPKTIVHNIIRELRKFISRELLAGLYTVPNLKSLLQESAEERNRRESKLAEFDAVKNALHIIENFHINMRQVSRSITPTTSMSANAPNAMINTSFKPPEYHNQPNTNLRGPRLAQTESAFDFSQHSTGPSYINMPRTPPQRPLPPPLPPRPFDRPST